MSAGLFLGIRAAFPPEDADRVLAAVASALASENLPSYEEPWDMDAAAAKYDQLRAQARTKLDVLGPTVQPLARMIVRSRGTAGAGPFRDFTLTTERIFVPGDWMQRIEAPGTPGRALWSTGSLVAAVKSAGMTLGLPMVSGEVPADMLPKIDKGKKLSKNDPVSADEDEHNFTMLGHYRPTWLALAEFARVAHANQIAFVLANG
jgi:hypothetical protein